MMTIFSKTILCSFLVVLLCPVSAAPVFAGQGISINPYPVKNISPHKPKKIERGFFADVLTPAPAHMVDAVPLVHPQGLERWQAFRGADIRDVLELWSADAGVSFMWNTSSRINVLNNMSVSASYENAVRDLLEQYRGRAHRPVASLHIDDKTGARTLVVQSEGGLAF